MSRYKHIIWDWNGTLWDDTWLCVEINNHMLGRRGLPEINLATYQDKLCFPVDRYYCQLGFDYGREPYRRLAEEFIAEYTERRYECVLHIGARELIAGLKEKGIPQAVLSAYQQDTLLQAVEFFRLTPFFDAVIGLDDIYASGKVANGLQYISQLRLDPAEVVFIGDTVHDFEVAQAMGVQSMLIDHGHNSRSRLEACGAPVLSSLADIQGLLCL